MAVAPSVPHSDQLPAHRSEIESELERVCLSPWFRTSRRSCEFLRYVVRATLDGRADSLKERSIGMDLLGRDISYDPGSDASVRVRANDVRKRLLSCYGAGADTSPLRIILPTGSYVPHFVRSSPELDEPAPEETPTPQRALDPPVPQRRSWLLVPLLAALAGLGLLLCGLLIRHPLEARQNYRLFWNGIFSGRGLLLLSISHDDRERLASGLYPLVWMAGRYGVRTLLSSGPLTGATTDTFAKLRLSSGIPDNWEGDRRLHWLLEAGDPDSASAPVLFLRSSSGSLTPSAAPRAALLTILPESPAILYVQSTDQDSLRKLFEDLTAAEPFPREMALPLPASQPFQILLTTDAADRATVQVWEPGSSQKAASR